MTAPVTSPDAPTFASATAPATGTSPLPSGEGQGEGRPSLTKHFTTIASAPNGIKKLRELILELAVRGKLVPQDTKDEAAAELLRQIRKEKAQLVAEGNLPKGRPPKADDCEGLDDGCPSGWVRASLSDIGSFMGGKTPSTRIDGYWGGDIPWVTPKDMKALDIKSSEDKVRLSAVENGLGLVSKDSVLIVVRSGILRRTVPVAVNRVECTVNQDIKALCLARPSMAEYVRLMIRGFERIILSRLTKVGTTVESIKFEEFERFLFLLPPLAEQRRIVAKVDELMALCDQLEAQQADADAAHEKLVRELLATLTQSQSPADFQSNWQRLATHFDTLFTTESSIEVLQGALIELAVMGKLVQQDASDESVNDSLKRFFGERDALVVEGKVKKRNFTSEVEEEEASFVVPRGWGAVRLASLAPEFQNGVSSRGDEGGRFATVIRLADIERGEISLANTRQLPIGVEKIKKNNLKCGDILVIRVNGSADLVGRFVVCHGDMEAIPCDHFIRMRLPSELVNSHYLKLVGDSSSVRRKIADMFVSTAGQKTVNQGHIGSLVLALPPLAEQSRIVAKFNELIGLCGTLQSLLLASRQLEEKVSESLVASGA